MCSSDLEVTSGGGVPVTVPLTTTGGNPVKAGEVIQLTVDDPTTNTPVVISYTVTSADISNARRMPMSVPMTFPRGSWLRLAGESVWSNDGGGVVRISDWDNAVAPECWFASRLVSVTTRPSPKQFPDQPAHEALMMPARRSREESRGGPGTRGQHPGRTVVVSISIVARARGGLESAISSLAFARPYSTTRRCPQTAPMVQ